MISIDNYRISWRHHTNRKPFQENGKGPWFDGLSECIVQDQNKHVLAVGKSWKHVSDNHCRAEGRRHSLPRALKQLTKDMPKYQGKALRRRIWQAYLGRGKQVTIKSR